MFVPTVRNGQIDTTQLFYRARVPATSVNQRQTLPAVYKAALEQPQQ
jgi:hypothetical protein